MPLRIIVLDLGDGENFRDPKAGLLYGRNSGGVGNISTECTTELLQFRSTYSAVNDARALPWLCALALEAIRATAVIGRDM